MRLYVPYLTGGRVPDYMKEHHVDYVILPTGFDDASPEWSIGPALGLTNQPSLALVPVAEYATPYDLWWRAWPATRHATPRQILYRVEYRQAPIPPSKPAE